MSADSVLASDPWQDCFFLISQENKHTAQTHVNDHSSLFYPCCFKCYVLNTFPASLVFHTSLFVVTPVLMDCL